MSLELGQGERVAVIGENGAGKTTLMNVLYGLYQPDSGEVWFDGVKTKLRTPADAMARGVGMVHQHFTLVPTLTVAENVVLGAEPTRFGLFDVSRAIRDVEATCQKFGFTGFDVRAKVAELTVGMQQKVEIVKALHRGVKTLILDEPTAVLTPQEADEFIATSAALADQGLTVVLISHKLKDVLRFASRIVVLRRGRKVAEVASKDTTAEALARLMVGDREVVDVESKARPHAAGDAPPMLALEGVTGPKLHGVSLTVRAGEIVGVAGVDGNGQRELAGVLTGLGPWHRGTVRVAGVAHTVASYTPRAARRAGVAHIPEDRLRRAMVSDLSVEENAALGRHDEPPFATKGGALIDFAGRRARTQHLLEANDVRPRAPDLRMGSLSGGNQQKLVVGRELDGQPKALVVMQPTRGLDLAAVAAVRAQLLDARARGCAVLLASLDLDELLALSDRVLVMFEGRIIQQFERGAYDERRIGRAMLGVVDA